MGSLSPKSAICMTLLYHHTVVWGILSLLCVILFFFGFFLCTVTNFSAAEKARGVKFGMHVGLLSGQVFSHFGKDCLAGSHGGDGITSRMNAPMKSYSQEMCVPGNKYWSQRWRSMGNWAFGIAGGGVSEERMVGYASCKPADALNVFNPLLLFCLLVPCSRLSWLY